MGRLQEEQHGMVPAKIKASERHLHNVESWTSPKLQAMSYGELALLALVSTAPGSEVNSDLKSYCKLVVKPRQAVGPS